MPPRLTVTRLSQNRTYRCWNELRRRIRSSSHSARRYGTAETVLIMLLTRIIFRCRRFRRSAKTCPTIRPLPEHTHWTANAARCYRQLGKRFGDNAYAAEELVAELGAAFTCAHLGLSTEPRADHAQYINSWLRVLKADKRAIFTAASKAQAAADYLIQRAGVPTPAQVQEVAA